jgi:hypothetical protein
MRTKRVCRPSRPRPGWSEMPLESRFLMSVALGRTEVRAEVLQGSVPEHPHSALIAPEPSAGDPSVIHSEPLKRSQATYLSKRKRGNR